MSAASIRPVTYDVPGPDVLRKGRWFDFRTGRRIPGGLHAIPMDTAFEAGSPLSVRRWSDYITGRLQRLPFDEEDDPDVRITDLQPTGKESRHLEDIAASLRIPGEEVLLYHLRQQEDLFTDEILRAAIRNIPIPMSFLIEQTRLHHRSIQRFLNVRGLRREPVRLRTTTRRLLVGAVDARIREHPEAGMIPASIPSPNGHALASAQTPVREAPHIRTTQRRTTP